MKFGPFIIIFWAINQLPTPTYQVVQKYSDVVDAEFKSLTEAQKYVDYYSANHEYIIKVVK